MHVGEVAGGLQTDACLDDMQVDYLIKWSMLKFSAILR